MFVAMFQSLKINYQLNVNYKNAQISFSERENKHSKLLFTAGSFNLVIYFPIFLYGIVMIFFIF